MDVGEQSDYVLASPTITHKVEKDTGRTLQRVAGAIIALRDRFGPDVIITVTLAAHIPARLDHEDDSAE